MQEEEANKIELDAVRAVLDRGVRYSIGDESLMIRPLKYGTVLTICEQVAQAGLTLKTIEEGEDDLPGYFIRYGNLMLTCVAIAELNDKMKLNEEQIQARVEFYKETLHNYQVYELFVQVLQLSGIQAFTNTIRLLLTMKQQNLSPRMKGS